MKKIESTPSYEHPKENEIENSETTKEQKSEEIQPTRLRLEAWKHAIENQRAHTENAEVGAKNIEQHPNYAQLSEKDIADQRDYAKRQREMLNKMEANFAKAQEDWQKRLDQLPPNVYVEYMGALNNFKAIQAEKSSGRTFSNNESIDLQGRSNIAENKLHEMEKDNSL